jgi:subtilase family serine protease
VSRIGIPVAAVAGLAALSLVVPGASVATRAALPRPVPAIPGGVLEPFQFPEPMSTTDCVSEFQVACYSPTQYRVAYDLNSLYSGRAAGRPITGAGETIVIVDSFGSPTIQDDLRTFDAQFGLPNPRLTIDRFGSIPPFDPNNADMVGWAEEATLDVEYSHVFAPGANIVLVETPVDQTVGVTGFPQMMRAEESLINQGIGDVFVHSLGAPENTFPGFSSGNYSSLTSLRYAFEDAYAHHVTVLAASGDTGATGPESLQPPYPMFPYRVAAWPASDPLVTAVGGTAPNLNDNGNRLSPDVVWNDLYGASGGGDSAVFSRPNYQIGVTGTVGSHRGMPDISLAAAPGAWGYLSFDGAGGPGWYIFGGTSQATPMMAGIVALADQLAGHRLGLINQALYQLGELHQEGIPGTGIVSVTSGNNTFDGVTGYNAGPGYSLVTGWGTLDATQFVRALVRVSH